MIPPDALVVFTGETEIFWLRVILKPGFRHCFVLVRKGTGWISLDPLAHRIDLDVPEVPDGFDLAGWLSGRGLIVIPATIDRRVRGPAFFAPMNCVEAVKRVLGLRAWRVVTPWQLYRHLVKR